MKQYRTAEEIKKFDIFKGITFLILVILLLLAWFFLRPTENPPSVVQATGEPIVSPSTTEPTVTTAPTTTPPPTMTPQPTATTAPTEPPPTAISEPTAPPAPVTVEATAEPEIAAPVVNLPGGEVAPGQVALAGTGEPGSEVEVVIDGQVVGKTAVGSDGTWSFTADLPEPGDYQISVQNVDASGQVIAASEPAALTLTTPPVTAPTLDRPSGELTAGPVTLTGSGEPGFQVEVVVEGQVVGKATVGDDGTWSLTAELSSAGDYEIRVQSVDADGQVLAASETIKLTVAAAKEVAPPTFDLPGGNLTGGPVTLTGTGEPGSEVEIVIDGRVVGRTTVGSNGEWSFKTELASQLGAYEISVRSIDAAGKVLAASEPAALTVAAPPTLDRPSGELTAGSVTLTGSGEPGSQVEVVVDGQVVGSATVGDDGTWSLAVELSPAGDYETRVQSIDADGQVLAASAPVKLTVTAAEQEQGQIYIVQADDWLSKLALKFYSDMMQYPVIVEATNAKAREDSSFTIITNPDLIEIGQKLWIPDVAP
jgi:outer membrane biosynthesis protein TonB